MLHIVKLNAKLGIFLTIMNIYLKLIENKRKFFTFLWQLRQILYLKLMLNRIISNDRMISFQKKVESRVCDSTIFTALLSFHCSHSYSHLLTVSPANQMKSNDQTRARLIKVVSPFFICTRLQDQSVATHWKQIQIHGGAIDGGPRP